MSETEATARIKINRMFFARFEDVVRENAEIVADLKPDAATASVPKPVTKIGVSIRLRGRYS